MPKKKKGGGGGGMPAGYSNVVEGVNNWNQNFQNSYGEAVDWAQNNPWAQGAQAWYGDMMGNSGMGTNAWSNDLFGAIQGSSQDEGLSYLRDFLGGPAKNGQGGSGGSGYRGSGGPRSYSGGGSSYAIGGGSVPDSTVGSGWWSTNVKELFDPAHLDPANDPTLAPMIDAYKGEAEEAYYRSLHDLTNAMEGSGRYGTGTYQAMRVGANEEYNEALQAQLAQIYNTQREAVMGRRMQGLDMTNTRDIAAGQIAAQRDAANASASAAGYAADVQRDIANRQLQLEGISTMLQANQFGLGLQGQMANMLQSGQLGAGQLGLGFGQLGMQGYDAQQGFGQLGLGAMGQLGDIYSSAAANRLRQQQMAQENARWNEQQPIRDITSLIDIMSGLNEMGGYGMTPGYVPDAGPAPSGYGWGDVMGSLLGGAGAWLNYGQGG